MAKYYVLTERATLYELLYAEEYGNRNYNILGDYTENKGVLFNREQARARRDDLINAYVTRGQFEVHWRLRNGKEINDVFKIDLHDEEYEKSGKYPYCEIYGYSIHENAERYYDANMFCRITIRLEEKDYDEG